MDAMKDSCAYQTMINTSVQTFLNIKLKDKPTSPNVQESSKLEKCVIKRKVGTTKAETQFNRFKIGLEGRIT